MELNKIIELQNQGLTENEIYQKLRNAGMSPKEIQDAMTQVKIKNAVSAQDNVERNPPVEYSQVYPQNQNYPSNQNYPPINPQENYQQNYPPSPQNYPPQNYDEQQPYPQQEQAEQYQEYYPESPQAYSNQNYYYQPPAQNNETISEIAEQITMEKISELKKEIGDFPSFKSATQDKISDLDDRLKRIENSIDKLQQAIIGKIGDFGEKTEIIQKDLDGLHDTVSKLMNPLIDNYNELKKTRTK